MALKHGHFLRNNRGPRQAARVVARTVRGSNLIHPILLGLILLGLIIALGGSGIR